MQKKGKTLLTLLMCGMFMFLVGGKVQASEIPEEVQIPDQNLKKLINVTLEKEEAAPITKQEMESLVELDTMDIPTIESSSQYHTHGIKDLTGLEYAVNLETLILKQNDITDLSPIGDLTKLKKLDVHRNELVDIGTLENLTNLEWLDIYNNKIVNLAPLGKLTSLKYLDMHYVNRQTAKIDITPLANLVNLDYLSLESNLITDISCLKPIVENANLETMTMLLRVNHITDFSVIQPLLDQFYIEDGNIFGDFAKGRVGTIGQTDDGAAREIKAPMEGGKVEVQLPRFKGFENVDKAIAEIFEAPTIGTVTLEEAIDGVEVEYDLEKNTAVFTFADNTIGNKIDVKSKLIFAYEGTDFTYSIPVRITQSTKFSAMTQMNNADKGILHIDTTKENAVSDGGLSFTILDENGKLVDLESVAITFAGANNDLFEATEPKVDNGAYTYRIKVKADVTVEEGNYAIKPIVQFQVSGDETVYKIEENEKQYNLYVAASESAVLSSHFVVDLSQESTEGKYLSRRYNVSLPNNREINWITVNNSDGKQVYTTTYDEEWQAGKQDGFTLTLPLDEWDDHFVITIMPKTLAKDAMIKISDVGVKYVYSKKDAEIEAGFGIDMKTEMKTDETQEVSISKEGTLHDNFIMTSSDPKIAGVEDHILKAEAEGKAVIEFSNLYFDYMLNDRVFESVAYENPIQKEVTVQKVIVPPTTDPETPPTDPETPPTTDSQTPPTTNPETPPTKPSDGKPSGGAVPTGDNVNGMRIGGLLGATLISALGMILIISKKRQDKVC